MLKKWLHKLHLKYQPDKVVTKAKNDPSTLILAPSQATNVWKHETRRFFPEIQAHCFFYNPSRLAPSRERTLTLSKTIKELLQYLSTIPDSPYPSPYEDDPLDIYEDQPDASNMEDDHPDYNDNEHDDQQWASTFQGLNMG